MRCDECPAYWEDRDYYYGVQDWGCYCDPKVVMTAEENLQTEITVAIESCLISKR